MTDQPTEQEREYVARLFRTKPEPEKTGDPMRDFANQLFANANLDD